MEVFLDEARSVMSKRLSETSLGRLSEDYMSVLGNGKMLRARMVYRVGTSTGLPREELVRIAASVEMIHAGSLLHDDVIDGAELRRDAPAFWIEHGIQGAILLGDLLFFLSLDLLQAIDGGRLVPLLVRIAGEICEGESEQELVLRGRTTTWEQCVSIARRKTGALFAFAASASAGRDADLGEALREAGYALGTAYQLADDVLDATGTPDASSKTLGSDNARDKATVVTVNPPDGRNAHDVITELCLTAEQVLEPWPDVRKAWQGYMEDDIAPVLQRYVRRAVS
jgi:geranylgeranyl pyrophosphate synthase